jgi:NADPH-dependent 2,4-dienoyl-CoA reductase/sulfur reductase-like enzyme
MKSTKHVILGGGMVAGYCAQELVALGLKPGELAIVSGDSSVPYERPPLSKTFLAGKDSEENIRINIEEFYPAHGIDLKLRTEAAAVDSGHKVVHLRSGEELFFENLVIATGARVRKLNVSGADLPGLHYLRSLDDAKRIRAHAQDARRAAVIGGGFIAMEVASVLSQKGLETTMIVRENRIWARLFTPAMSHFFENYYSARGVRFVKQARVEALQGSAAVESVSLRNERPVPCDLVVAGVGVQPVTDPVAVGRIEVTDGVVVNEYLETAVPGIFAAGDIANYRDTLFDTRRRVEHWDNAVSQGRHAARLLSGDRAPFVHVPYFFSDVFDLSYEFWGDPRGADAVVERGDLATNTFSVWWLSKGRLLAAFAMNRSDEERNAAPRWIESKQPVDAAKLKSAASVLDAEPLKTSKAG